MDSGWRGMGRGMDSGLRQDRVVGLTLSLSLSLSLTLTLTLARTLTLRRLLVLRARHQLSQRLLLEGRGIGCGMARRIGRRRECRLWGG